MNGIVIKCCEKPKCYQDDQGVKILVLNIEITNRCIFTKKGLSVSICPADSGGMEQSFEQRMCAKNDSFIAADIPINPVYNDFIFPFTLKRSQSIKGNAIIALKKDCWCNSIQIVTQKGKVISELEINPHDVEIESYFIEKKI